MIIIQTTVADDKNAKELINLLLEKNKIACGRSTLFSPHISGKMK
jgi:uncharacterized protein involved in tolerance to divalent cations